MAECCPVVVCGTEPCDRRREKDRQNLEILCSDLAELAPQAPRRQLRACLKLKTSLGKYVNKESMPARGCV